MLLGKKLGRYDIRKKIGSGGMGEVYLAHDEKLDRNVALKVLLPEFCSDLDRVERFKHEAKAASALNHPNIITIHEIDESGNDLFIATEFVDGETLREKIENGELTLIESIKIAEQVADALAVAHEAGIIHRDIKPENIMIRRDGYVKILDFGLAKPIYQPVAASEAEEAIRQMIKTQPGMVMGSARYMSPEQARSKETTERTDVWSLGVVLYEMLTGKNPFDGETVSDSLAALIHIEPEPIDDVPEEMRRIVRKALQKSAADRYQSIKDFSLDLKDLRLQLERRSLDNSAAAGFSKGTGLYKQNTSENKTLIHQTQSAENITDEQKGSRNGTRFNTAPVKSSGRFLPFGLLFAAVVVAAGAWFFLPGILKRPAPSFEAIQIKTLTENGSTHSASVSSDGKFIAFINSRDGRDSLVVRQISNDNFVGDSSVVIVQPTSLRFFPPTFSPDDTFIYYVSIENAIGTLYRTQTIGGEGKKLLVDVDSPVTFSPDGKQMAFLRHNPNDGGDTIFIADKDGGNLKPFVETKEIGFDKINTVTWSPDNKRLLVSVYKSAGDGTPKLQIAAIELENKKLKRLGDRDWYGGNCFKWIEDGTGIVFIGKISFGDNWQIWHLRYPDGEARQITSDTSNYASLSASADGKTLVSTKADTISSFWSLDPARKELRQLTSENRTLIGNRGISQMPDGRILYSKTTGKEINIFAMDENEPNNEKQLTAENSFNSSPVATPDGRYIVFVSNRRGALTIWRMNADGSGPLQLTDSTNGIDEQLQVTNDGKFVIFTRIKADGSRPVLMKVSIDGGGASPLLPEENEYNLQPRLSPDGKLLAYNSFDFDTNTASAGAAVKIAALNEANVARTDKQLNLGAQTEFKFAPDSKSLTYVNRSGIDNIRNVSLDDKKETPLTDFKSGVITNFLWSHDGKRLLIVRGIVNNDLVLIKDRGRG